MKCLWKGDIKADQQVVGAVIIFFLGFSLGRVVEGFPVMEMLVILAPIATLGSAYFGAKYAFDLQEKKEIKKAKDRKIISRKTAIFDISQMNRFLTQYSEDIVEPSKVKMWPEMKSYPELYIKDFPLNLESLSFLIEEDSEDLLGKISSTKQKFSRILVKINTHSNLYRNKVEPFDDLNQAFSIDSGLINKLRVLEKDLTRLVDSTVKEFASIENQLVHDSFSR